MVNSLRKAFNWLQIMDLIPKNIGKLSEWQVKCFLRKLTTHYIADNREHFSLFSSNQSFSLIFFLNINNLVPKMVFKAGT